MSLSQIFFLCFIITRTFASTCKPLDSGKHMVGYRITDGVLKTLNRIGILGCQKQCVLMTKCQSIGYNKVTLECSLGQYADNKTFTGVTTDVFIRPNVTDDIMKNLSHCKNRPCASTERCVLLSGGSYTCMELFRPIDLTVLLDGSKSMGHSEYYACLRFIAYLINRLIDIRLAAATFDSETTINFYFDQFLSKSDMVSGLNDSVVYPDRVGNRLGQGLLDVHSGIYNQSRGDRGDAIDVILVLLDPDDMDTGNLDNADYVKSAGVRIITVGIGSSEVGLGIMQQVASEPVDNFVFSVNSTADLYVLYDTIINTINMIT